MVKAALIGIAKSVLQALASPALDEFRLLWGQKKELQRLQDTVTTIRDVLHDADRRQADAAAAVQGWLTRLRVVLYEADDLFDLISAQVLHDKVNTGNKIGRAVDFVSSLQRVHESVVQNLTTANTKYKEAADRKRRHVEFTVGDFVWAILTKERFSVGEYNKLSAKKIGPVEIIEKINPNAYRLQLPAHIRTADVFNVKHLIPFAAESPTAPALFSSSANSWANFHSPGGNDVNAVVFKTVT